MKTVGDDKKQNKQQRKKYFKKHKNKGKPQPPSFLYFKVPSRKTAEAHKLRDGVWASYCLGCFAFEHGSKSWVIRSSSPDKIEFVVDGCPHTFSRYEVSDSKRNEETVKTVKRQIDNSVKFPCSDSTRISTKTLLNLVFKYIYDAYTFELIYNAGVISFKGKGNHTFAREFSLSYDSSEDSGYAYKWGETASRYINDVTSVFPSALRMGDFGSLNHNRVNKKNPIYKECNYAVRKLASYISEIKSAEFFEIHVDGLETDFLLHSGNNKVIAGLDTENRVYRILLNDDEVLSTDSQYDYVNGIGEQVIEKNEWTPNIQSLCNYDEFFKFMSNVKSVYMTFNGYDDTVIRTNIIVDKDLKITLKDHVDNDVVAVSFFYKGKHDGTLNSTKQTLLSKVVYFCSNHKIWSKLFVPENVEV